MKASSSAPLTPQSAAEELIVAQALALYRDSKTIAKNAPHGQFLNHAEAATLDKGRKFMTTVLQTLAQEEIDHIEKLFYRYSVARRKNVRNAKQKNDTSAIDTKTSSPPPEK